MHLSWVKLLTHTLSCFSPPAHLAPRCTETFPLCSPSSPPRQGLHFLQAHQSHGDPTRSLELSPISCHSNHTVPSPGRPREASPGLKGAPVSPVSALHTPAAPYSPRTFPAGPWPIHPRPDQYPPPVTPRLVDISRILWPAPWHRLASPERRTLGARGGRDTPQPLQTCFIPGIRLKDPKMAPKPSPQMPPHPASGQPLRAICGTPRHDPGRH